MKFKDYNHVTPIQIRFNDIDVLNHLNNSCYLSFFELGRVNYFKKTLKNNIKWDKKGFVLARTEIDHVHPIFLEDEVYCFTKVTKFGKKSLTIKNSIVKKVKNELIECASGIGILVAMDYKKKSSINILKNWKELIELFESSHQKTK